MVMKKAFDGDYPLREGAEKSFWTFPISSMTAAACSMFCGNRSGPLGFLAEENI
jgi:hypothetical protein